MFYPLKSDFINFGASRGGLERPDNQYLVIHTALNSPLSASQSSARGNKPSVMWIYQAISGFGILPIQVRLLCDSPLPRKVMVEIGPSGGWIRKKFESRSSE